MNKMVFSLVMMDDALNFLRSLPKPSRDKIMYNINRVAVGEKNIELFKKLEGTEIWEFRTLYNKTAYRLFSFWDTEEQTLVVATHGIIKKTQKTPEKEIQKAERMRTAYFSNKQKQK